jgi:type IV pilus modification protein PilV
MPRLSAAIIKKGHNEKGFSLLEVIVAISVLTIGLLAVASMQASAIRGNASAYGITEGTNLASDQIEKLMIMPYDNPYPDDSYDYPLYPLEDRDKDGKFGLEDDTASTADHNVNRGKYTVYWNVAVDDTAKGTKTVNVIVTWADHGIQKRVSMRNIIASQ